MYSLIWYEGYFAFELGALFNPYSFASLEECSEWQAGYDAAKEDYAAQTNP
jgi:hypothetical protein